MEGGGTPYSSSMAPSGSYILIIVSQPVTDDHKQPILDRLNKGLLSWDVDSTGCDLSGLETVCADINAKHLNDTDVLIQHSTESLGVEVLVSPTVSTLKQCVKNLFSTSTGHKHLIHAGYTFAGSGSWILQNGTFSFDEFLEIFQQADVQSQKRCNINVHCAEVGPWNSANFAKDIFTKVANVSFNPTGKVERVPGSEHLTECLRKVLSSQALEEIMEASTLIGNIRFNRPTLYLFPAGQGDCALFGINGFNMLIDGGFNRKPCSWEFIRHLDRLDAMLVTRLCENNVCGMSTLMKRKSLNNTYPQIGYVFCNIAENNISPKSELIKDKDDLIISVVGEGHNFTNTLNELKLKPHQCWRDSSIEPFVLYHKVGHGTLEMHVLSPPKDSKEMKDFLSEWSSYKETFSNIKSGSKTKSLESSIPLSHATSICAVLVWRPADPKDTITRILFPGSAPQSKIFESLDKLKALDILKQPVVTKASLSAVTVTKTVTKIEKTVSRASIPNRKNTASPALSVSSVASRNGDIAGVKKEVKKVVKEVRKDNKDLVKKEIKKEVKKEIIAKDIKKVESTIKKDVGVKKDISKEPKKENKEVKKIVKKENKDLKTVTEKKTAPKKAESSNATTKAVGEVKKTATTTVRKSTTAIKKDVSKTSTVQKSSEVRKSAPSKLSEPKTAKDVNNKKAAETKSVPKPKPKTTPTAPKTSTPKTKAAAVPKPGNMTKAVAASSIVASAVAVTVAALELNEKKEEIVDEIEPENISEKEPEIAEDLKDIKATEKSEEEINVSPLPPEALSPTPSDSVSLTPSDTLSSAPLETVSPTPPLGNEPMSIEEKEVNEIKEIDQDLETFEAEVADEEAPENVEVVEEVENATEVNDIELELAKRQKNDDVMSMSFVGLNDEEEPVEEVICKAEVASQQFSAINSHAAESEERIETFEKADEDKEIDSAEKIDLAEEVESEKVIESQQNEYGNVIESNEKDIDEQLAHLSMEGSFCAGRPSYDQENEIIAQLENEGIQNLEQVEKQNDDVIPETSNLSQEKEEETSKGFYENEEVPQNIQMHESFIADNDSKFENTQDVDDHYENKEILDVEEQIQPSHITSNMSAGNFEDNHFSSDNDKFESELQEKEVEVEKHLEKEHFPPSTFAAHGNAFLKEEYDNRYGMEESISHGISNEDYDISQNIIADAEMQETSVDEPEEIVRKESAVSITLNDEELGGSYDDNSRRKSYTESEDDVDIQNYMTNDRRDSYEQDKLGVKRDSDSDNEDVVKSPTPHAIVDYEGNTDDITKSATSPAMEVKSSIAPSEDIAYPSEKEDFDEKDHDSAEDQEDIDDGEMIRHPTPPQIKYSEDEMRDPIGPHYITDPGLKSQIPGITEQPLYEEPEDAGSERSVSPLVEQPVFGNVVQADFPELVTVSGGTTPSEPQSPKTGFSSNKFATETAVMDALSEHDCSESSAPSPLCHDANAFEMPVVEDTLQAENAQVLEASQGVETSDFGMVKNVEDAESLVPVRDDDNVPEHPVAPLDTAGVDKLSELHGAENDSDDDSYSQNDQSETRSEKSDGADEKSDIHRDDKSDNQHDGKSDVMDDDQLERRSDIHEDDRSDSHFDDKQDDYDGKGADSYDMQEGTRSHDLHGDQYGTTSATDYEMHYERYEIKDDFQSNAQEDIQDGARMENENVDVFDRNSLTEETSLSVRQSDDFDMISGSASEISQIKTEALEHLEGLATENVEVKDEGFGGASCKESNLPEMQNEGSKMFSSEVSDNFNIPSGFNEEEVAYPSNNYSSSIGQNEDMNDQFGLPPSNQLPLDASNVDDFHSERFETSENVITSEDIYSNNLPKHQTEIIEDATGYDNYPDHLNEMRMMQQNEFDITNKFSEHSDLPSAVGVEFSESSEQHAYNLAQSSDPLDDDAPQHSENFSNLENKSLPEMTEAHQYETLSKFEENVHTSNAAYSESSLTSNVISYENETVSVKEDTEDPNFNYASESLIRSSEMHCEQTTVMQREQISYESGVTGIEFSKDFESVRDMTNGQYDGKELAYTQGFEESEYSLSNSGNIEQSTFNSQSSETKEYHQEFNPNVPESGILGSESASTFGLINGKDDASWSHSASEYTTQYVTETSSTITETHAGYSTTEQETSYIINSRFHSDSPEDNIMRSDSSPDVPPYPVDSTGQLTDLKHLVSGESQPFNQTQGDYSNMNLPDADSLPQSPVKALNANRDANSYAESSEEEDSSSIPGTVSPYAYTNKAYAKEEEDLDGNHIYKESITIEKTSGIIQEFDDNNPQSVTTHQVSYSQGYQETQYPGETNYDFRLEEWGKPMGLPTPPDSTQKTVAKKADKPGVKSVGKSDTNGKVHSPSVASKLSSPIKKSKTSKEPSSAPVYVDLAYVPHHGDPQYCDVEFFKKIRARYYVFSGINPSKEVLNALLEAKKTWKEDLEVTIIPTYETDTLGYWMAQNQDDLAEYSIEVAPSASRCTVNLQDYETSCAAYRLEF